MPVTIGPKKGVAIVAKTVATRGAFRGRTRLGRFCDDWRDDWIVAKNVKLAGLLLGFATIATINPPIVEKR